MQAIDNARGGTNATQHTPARMPQLHIDTEQPQFNPMLLGAGEIRLPDTARGLTLGHLMGATTNKRKLISAVLAGPLLVAGAICAGAQTAKPNLTIILDSSRSMWGQINGINKVVSARTVIGKLAKTHAAKLDFGLVSYGHRRNGGCGDIEVLLAPGAHKPAKITKTVNAIKPNGSTPIAEALKAAAAAAKFKERNASLLLISDGLDNCSGDPCAVAGALKSQSPGLSIHVIAFDRKEQASLKKLACIAEKTGGTFTPATGEAVLMEAATGVADRVLAPPAPAVAAPAAAPPPQAAPETTASMQPPEQPLPATPAPTATMQPPAQPPQIAMAPPPDRKPGAAQPMPESAKTAKGDAATPNTPAKPTPVSLSASLVDGGEKLQNGLVWRIFEPKPTKSGKYKLVGSYRTPAPTAALAPGEYLVNAAYGLAHLTKKIQVQAGQSYQETFILNAGGLRLGATLTNGESIPPNSIRYDIFAGEADQFGNRKKILGDAKPGLIIRLNAGAYHVVSVYGDANAVVRADVAVEPGRLTEATINHAAARVTFKLVLQPGGEALADTQWNVLTPGGDVVKESAGALPTHILAAGTYSVLARHQGKNYTRDFEVVPGDVKQIEVVTQ